MQDARGGGETKEFAHYLMQSLLCTVQSPWPTLLKVIFKNAEKKKILQIDPVQCIAGIFSKLMQKSKQYSN